MNVLDLYKSKLLEAKKAGFTHGGEWCGPCPECGGDDRFRVWPEQNGGKGSFWCRGCDKAGDNITFLMVFEGKSYQEACRALDIELKKEDYRTPRAPGDRSQKSGVRSQKEKAMDPGGSPPDLWVEKAGALVAWAQEQLLNNRVQMKWLADRGIDKELVIRFKLGWNPGKDGKDLWRPRESWGLPTVMKENKNGKMVKKKIWIPKGLIIPLLSSDQVHRIRIRRPEGEPRYYIIPGSNMDMMAIGENYRAYIILESELDGIMVFKEAGKLVGVVALGSSSAKPDENLIKKLRDSAVILLSLDYDAAGAKAVAWWKWEFSQAKTWPVPVSTDPGEAYQAGIDIKAWISAGLPPGWSVGQSLLGSMKKKAPVQKLTEGSGVEELAGMLRKYPVMIRNTPERTFIAASLKWQRQNWEVYRRISELVFMTPEVFDYLAGHPEQAITGENVLWTLKNKTNH